MNSDSKDLTSESREEIPEREPRSAPERWLHEHGDSLFRFALARVKRRELAEDLVQDTLLAALRGQDQFRGEAAEQTWLHAILRRKIADYLRQKNREFTFTSLDQPDGWIDNLFDRRERWKVAPGRWKQVPSTSIEQIEFWRVFSDCLGKLPARMANAFSQREIDQADADEICKVLGISTTNLWVILYRARMRLWKCLDANWFCEERVS